MRADQGFPAIKLSCTAYQPEDHIELIHRVRDAVEPDVRIRFDAHGTWNYQEARRILHAVASYDVEFVEQPMNALLPPGSTSLAGRFRSVTQEHPATRESSTSAT